MNSRRFSRSERIWSPGRIAGYRTRRDQSPGTSQNSMTSQTFAGVTLISPKTRSVMFDTRTRKLGNARLSRIGLVEGKRCRRCLGSRASSGVGALEHYSRGCLSGVQEKCSNRDVHHFMPSWAQTFASRSFSSRTSASRRATLACTAASSEMPRDGDSAAKPAAEDDCTAGAPERRCIQRFSREPGWRGSSVTSAPSGRTTYRSAANNRAQ
jgi:hypothetical protein